MFQAMLNLTLMLTMSAAVELQPAAHGNSRVERVILICLDGLSTEGLLNASTPNLDSLSKNGVLLEKSRGVMPSKSAPNWASILTGVQPNTHGIHSNQWWWLRWKRYLEFPTLFSALRRSGKPNPVGAVVHEWDHFGKLVHPRDVDARFWSRSATETLMKTDEALALGPTLLVIHLLGIDNAGHSRGGQSPEYLKAVTRVDAQVGALLALFEEKSFRHDSLIIIASDHGGIGTTHGGDRPIERLTPVILNGPLLKRGLVIQKQTANVDLFATISRVLSLPTLGRFDGRVLREIFVEQP